MKKTIFDSFAERCETNGQLEILYLLEHSDRRNRVTRGELVDKLHRSDRAIRIDIEKMRENGIFIAADMRQAGYYLPRTYADYIVFEDAYTGRALDILKNKNRMHRLANELLSGQTRIGGIK